MRIFKSVLVSRIASEQAPEWLPIWIPEMQSLYVGPQRKNANTVGTTVPR